MTEPGEQALPFSEAAREAAAFTVYAGFYERGEKARQAAQTHWNMMTDSREPCYAKANRILTAAVDADPRAKACLKLAALTDDELVGRMACAFENRVGTTIGVGDGMRAAVAALGLPVAEQCAHEWRDARNAAVESGEVCIRCGAIRPGPRGRAGIDRRRRMSDDLPYWLREDAEPAATCSDCGRKSWDTGLVGQRCAMPQPSGAGCDGTMRPAEDAEGERTTDA